MSALLAVKAESGMERFSSPSGELHSTEHQQQKSVNQLMSTTSTSFIDKQNHDLELELEFNYIEDNKT